jgi:type 1 glutamine amidotransferase
MKRHTAYLWILLALAGCSKAPEILVVTGGHAFDTTEFFDLFRSLEGIGFDEVSHPAALDLLSSSSVGKYDLLLFYDYMPDLPLADSMVFHRLARMGMPMIFMHHALCNFQRWEGYASMVGGTYVMPGFHPDTSLHSGYAHDLDLTIEVLDPEHPVTRGIGEFVIHDEGYYNIQVKSGVHPLLGTQHPSCAPQVAWENRWNNSTCIYLMFGHDKQAYSNEHLKLLLRNSIQYLSNL